MDYESLLGGVEPGGLKEVYQVKILICYLLNSIDKPLLKDQINYVFQCDRLVNYFSFTTAFNELIKTNHLKINIIDNKEFYSLNDIGIETALKLEKSLPRSLKDKVVKTAIILLTKVEKDKFNKISFEKNNDIQYIKCLIKDVPNTDLMDLKVYVPDIPQGEFIKQNIENNTSNIYRGIISLLINDYETLKEIINDLEKKENNE